MRKTVLVALSLLVSSMYGWNGPYQLANSAGQDVNPSACKEWVQGEYTCLVWQSDRNWNWDIFSRCCELQSGNGWLAEKPVTLGDFDDVSPAVCVLTDDFPHKLLCVWERHDRPHSTTICAASGDSSGWSTPESLDVTGNGPSDSAFPSVICINSLDLDSAWVVWLDADSGTYRIRAMCFDFHWCDPQTIYSSATPVHHVRVGRRGGRPWGEWPLVVWEQEGEILWSELLNEAWTPPDTVAPSPASDREPDIISYLSCGLCSGPWITWVSERDGDTAVFGTPCDTFDRAVRWSDTTNAGRNWSPCGTVMYMTVDWEPFLGLCVSDRNGNLDIYDILPWDVDYWNQPVDTDPATDANPTLTTLGYADATTLCWAIWQSDRDGDWNIYGSFWYNTGIEEAPGGECGTTNTVSSIARGVLRVGDSRQKTRDQAELLDAAGRKVLDLLPGDNDVSALAPGVYFVRSEPAAGSRQPTAFTLRKVVVTR